MSKRKRGILIALAITVAEAALSLRGDTLAIILENLNDSRGLNYGIASVVAYLLGAY